MKYFVTGASGYIGSVVVQDLISHGYQVLGLARSDASADKISQMGAEVLRGELTDLEVLKQGASQTDGVLHIGFVVNFADMNRSLDIDEAAVKAFGDALEGTGKPLIYTTGLLSLVTERGAEPFDETYRENTLGSIFGRRVDIENYALGLKERGIRAMCIRLAPSIHGEGDDKFVPFLSKIFQESGYAGYPGDGENLWTACHKTDAAKLYRLAVEKGESGDAFHAAAEMISTKQIAEAVGQKYHLPVKSVPLEDVAGYFGFLAHFIVFHAPVKTEITRTKLGWVPTGPTLAEDIARFY